MTISKLHVVSTNDAPDIQPRGANSGLGGCAGPIRMATISDGVRLIEAFRRISDPDKRAFVIEQAEALADKG